MMKAFKRIFRDLTQVPLIVCSMRGHGKSTSTKTLISQLKEANDDVVIKVFDPSQAWYHKAPVANRIRVTADNMKTAPNLGDCVYEIGAITPPWRRIFVANILFQDYMSRYDAKLEDGDIIERLPRILYVFEEANTYFDSYSLNKKDNTALVLKDFISMGRNFGLDAILIATRIDGEVSPGIRNRSSWLIGKVSGEGERSALKRATSKAVVDVAEKIKRFHFMYYNGEVSEPFRIRDTVTNEPVNVEVDVARKVVSKQGGFLKGFLIGLGILFVIYVLMQIFL